MNWPSSPNWLRSASLVTIAVWALFGAVSSLAVYDSSSAALGPVAWADNWTIAFDTATWLIAPTMLCPALTAALGWSYLRGFSDRRWRAAWFSVAIVGLAVEPLLIWSARRYQFPFPQAGIDALNPLWLLAGFLIVAAAMIAMLSTAQPKIAPATPQS